MISLSDGQLRIMQLRVALFGRHVGSDVNATLKLRGRFTDADAVDVAQLAMAGLVR